MTRWKKTALFLLVSVFAACIVLGGLYYIGYTPEHSMSYEENQEVLDNPSRGFYYQVDAAREKLPEEIALNHIRLILLTFDLKAYASPAEGDGHLPGEKLTELRRALELAEEADVKVIFRAAYGFDSEDAYQDPEDVETVLSHIRQIAPILNEYADEILCVQAGMLGPWGEWHDSRLLGGTEEEDAGVRNLVLAEWLERLENSVTVNVRRPRFIRSAAKAGLDAGRLGFHNDALLSGRDDMGTYDAPGYDREAELNWIEENLISGVNGGEMPALSEYTKPYSAIEEFRKLRLTYLNSTYNKEVLEDWKSRGIDGESFYDIMERQLGYRLSLASLTINGWLRDFQELRCSFVLRNTGFAPIAPGYRCYLIADDGKDKRLCPVEGEKLSELLPEEQENENSQAGIGIRLPELLSDRARAPELLRIGLLITDQEFPEDRQTEIHAADAVRLANDAIRWEDGVNYIGQFERRDGKYVWTSEGGGSGAQNMRMVVFKIGKADAILLQSGQETLLIDTGEDEDGREILDYLDEQGIERIDRLILTHFDKDHVGGADKVIAGVEVGQIYQPDYDADSKQYKEYDEIVTNWGLPVNRVTQNVDFTCGDMKVTIYPPEKEHYGEDNDYSLVTGIIHGENRLLFAGDAESERLQELLGGGLGENPHYRLLKLPHHGRIEEETEAFLDMVQPDYAVITCSDKNPPEQEVVALLEQKNISTYLTSDGNIYVESDGRSLRIEQ